MIKVSVIVPVYNGEAYIKLCLNSILEQTLKEIEIIVVNDGSTDETKQILEDYQNQYENKIKVITKENEGQGKARNVGMDLAQGEFLTFVDADDTIESNMLQQMYEEAKKHDADVVVCDYEEIIQGKKIRKKAIPQKTNNKKRDYIVSAAGPCNKLIRTELLMKDNLRFRETGIYEDISIIPLVGLYANKIAYLEEPFYYYYIRQGSTMRQEKFNPKLLSIYDALETLTKGFEDSGKLEEYEKELEYIYIEHLLYAATGRFLEYKEGKKEIGKIVQIIKEKYPNWRKNPYYKKQGMLFKINCNIFYLNNLFIIFVFEKLKNGIKKGISWKN
ncbi:MAG: glycosyltransferase [Clostridia bacterium]|nr:glycosyltransferase [Clostridia bacterium]